MCIDEIVEHPCRIVLYVYAFIVLLVAICVIVHVSLSGASTPMASVLSTRPTTTMTTGSGTSGTLMKPTMYTFVQLMNVLKVFLLQICTHNQHHRQLQHRCHGTVASMASAIGQESTIA